MTNEREKRRSFRLYESVHLIYEVISERVFQEGRAQRQVRTSGSDGLRSRLLDLDARLAERLYLLRAESSAVAECIALMNEKLTAVIEQLPEIRKRKTSLAKRKPQICELGADGMLFGTEAKLAEGTHLALRFLLAPSHRYIETFATVRRQAPAPDSKDKRHPYGAVVEFVDLEPSQKEAIIQHLFNRESETLRARRRQLESDAL